MLIRIKGAISNCYLLLGDRPLLVGTGAPGDLKRILAALKSRGLRPDQLALILLTHAHSEHAGCAAELRRRAKTKIALHAADTPLAASGRNGVLAPQEPLGRLVRPFIDEPFEPFEPDIAFHTDFDLAPYGVSARVVYTPGHTPGSCSVVLPSGEALIGDVLRGSLMWPNKARPHFFCHDPELNSRSVIRLAREGLLRCHPGQFDSFPASELGRYADPGTGEVLEFSGETA